MSEKSESLQAERVEEKEVLQFPKSEEIKIEIVKKEVEGRIAGNNHAEDEVRNKLQIVRKGNRKGKRNWGPAYIIRVIDWCIAQKEELDIGKRAITRLAAEF